MLRVRSAGQAALAAGFMAVACFVERRRNIADADDADQAVIVDHRQVADVMPVHEMTNMLERVGRSARHQLLHRNELRNPQVCAGGAVFGDRADHVTLGEHADRGIALGANDILDHERADIARAHQLRGNGDGLVHANRCDTGGLSCAEYLRLAWQPPSVDRAQILVYIIPIVNTNSRIPRFKNR